MTKRELIDGVNRHTKRANRWGTLWLASLLSLSLLSAIVRDDAPRVVMAILGAAFIAVMLAAVLTLLLGVRRSMRQSGLVCPHCRALLTNVLAPVAVATGRCGKCGKPIVDSVL
jgi:hypothetical protein